MPFISFFLKNCYYVLLVLIKKSVVYELTLLKKVNKSKDTYLRDIPEIEIFPE